MNTNDIKTLIIVYSYHHFNTMKIAKSMSEILGATILTINEVNISDLDHYDMIGFGSGIDSGKHYQPLLDFVRQLPNVHQLPGFIFSTSAVQGKQKVYNDHTALRDLLSSKGYVIKDEFSCKGYNTNSILKYFGGMNKGKPDTTDLQHATSFAQKLMK